MIADSMPFPLAHPVVVLPLRRRRFRWLNFPAVVIGTLVPDLSYVVPHTSRLSHAFLGSIAFGLPLGAVIVAAFYAIRVPLLVRMPSKLKLPIPAARPRLVNLLWVVALSLIIGIWSHVLLDSLTHKDGWFVQHSSILSAPMTRLDGRTVRAFSVLWYVSSFAGTFWVFLAFEKWKQNAFGGRGEAGDRKNMIRDAIALAVLVVPISLVHHLIRNPIGFLITGACCLMLATLFIMRLVVPRENLAE